MGPCASKANDQASIGDNHSNRRVSDYQARRKESISRRSSVSWREPVVSSRADYDKGGSKNIGYEAGITDYNHVHLRERVYPKASNHDAAVFRSEPAVDPKVLQQATNFQDYPRASMGSDRVTYYSNLNIPTDTGVVTRSNPINQQEPGKDSIYGIPSYEFQTEPVTIHQSDHRNSGYQLDGNAVLTETRGETLQNAPYGNPVYDPMIGGMVYVLDQSVPVDDLELITQGDMKARTSFVNNEVIRPMEEPLQAGQNMGITI